MKKFRSVFLGLLVLVFTVILVACGNDSKTVANAKEKLEVGYKSPDTALKVTQDVTLPADVDGVTITWASDKPAVIAVNGKVVRPAATAADANVVLTATLTYKKASDTKTFDLKVLKEEVQVDGNVDLLKDHYKDTLANQEFAGLDDDIELITTLNGATITWESDKPAILSTGGVVNRPAFTSVDEAAAGETVTLKATLSTGGKVTFYVVVKKLEITEEEVVDIVLALATTKPSSATGYQEVNFVCMAKPSEEHVTKYGIPADTAITWATSNENVMTSAGVLVAYTTPEEQTVTLTATITYGDVTKSKSVEFKTKAVTPYENFADALVKDNIGKKVQLKGVSLFGTINGGFYIASKDNKLAYVYGNLPSGVVKGKLYDVICEVAQYYWTMQVTGASFTEVGTGSNNPTAVPVTLETILAKDAPSSSAVNQHEYWELSNVQVNVVDANDNYGTWLQVVGATDTPTGANSLMIYYQSNISVIRGLHGKTIDKIYLVNNGYRTDKSAWNANFLGALNDITLRLTDKEVVDTVKAGLEGQFSNVHYKAEDLDLPVAMQGATISWASSHPEIVSTAGVVLLPAEATDVTLTATITKGEETATAVIVIKVGPLSTSTIAEALAGTNKNVYQIEGVVTGYIVNQNTMTIQDSTGAISLSLRNYKDGDGKIIYPEVGKLIRIIGSRDVFNGLIQLDPAGHSHEVIQDEDLPAGLDITDLSWATADLLAHQSKLIVINSATVVSVNKDSYNNYSFVLKVGEKTINAKWDSRKIVAGLADYLATILADLTVNVYAPLGWVNNAPEIGISDPSHIVIKVPATDAEKAREALALLEVPATIREAQTITLPLTGENAAVISWVSSHPAIISNAGVVVMPIDNTVVTLTATAVVGEATESKDFNVSVRLNDNLTVVEARAITSGSVTFEGIVTGIGWRADGFANYIYVSDRNGAAAIPVYRTSSDPALPVGLAVGDKVQVVGTRGAYNGLEQATVPTITIISSENDLPAVNELTSFPVFETADQGKRYSITGTVVSFAGQDLVVSADATTHTFRIDWDGNVALLAHVGELIPGQPVTITAHLSWYYNGAQLLLFNVDEVVHGVQPDALALAYIKDSLESYYGGNSFYTGDKAFLPSAYDLITTTHTIVWAFDPVDLVVADVYKDVAADLAATMTATVTVGEAAPVDVELAVTILAIPASGKKVYVEKFDKAGLSTGYANGSFVGVYNSAWSFIHCRNQDTYAINGAGIMLRGGNGSKASTISVDIVTGLESFSFSYRKAFTGNAVRKYKVMITDGTNTATAVMPDFGATPTGADATVHTFNSATATWDVALSTLNLTGNLTITIIYNAATESMQTTVDDFTWVVPVV